MKDKNMMLHANEISDVTSKEPMRYGEYLASKLERNKITQIALAAEEGVNRAEVYRYLKIARWSKKVKDFIGENRAMLTNTDIVKAANSCGKDEQKVLDFLIMSIDKRRVDLRIVNNEECNTNSSLLHNNKCNNDENMNKDTSSEITEYKSFKFDKWINGIVTFVSYPSLMLVSLIILALVSLLTWMQVDAYAKSGFNGGLFVAISCELLLVVFSCLMSFEKRWYTKIFPLLILAGLFSYNLGVMSFEILNTAIADTKKITNGSEELISLKKRRDSLEKSLENFQKARAIKWINETNSKIEQVEDKITRERVKNTTSASLKMVEYKAWGLVYLRLLLMMSVVLLTHFLLKKVMTYKAA